MGPSWYRGWRWFLREDLPNAIPPLAAWQRGRLGLMAPVPPFGLDRDVVALVNAAHRAGLKTYVSCAGHEPTLARSREYSKNLGRPIRMDVVQPPHIGVKATAAQIGSLERLVDALTARGLPAALLFHGREQPFWRVIVVGTTQDSLDYGGVDDLGAWRNAAAEELGVCARHLRDSNAEVERQLGQLWDHLETLVAGYQARLSVATDADVPDFISVSLMYVAGAWRFRLSETRWSESQWALAKRASTSRVDYSRQLLSALADDFASTRPISEACGELNEVLCSVIAAASAHRVSGE